MDVRAKRIEIVRYAGVLAAMAAAVAWQVHRDPVHPRMGQLTGFVAILTVLALPMAVWVLVKRHRPAWPWRVAFVAFAAAATTALVYLVQRDDVDVIHALGFGALVAVALVLVPRRT